MSPKEKNEITHQIAYAERQFLTYQARVLFNLAIGKHQVADRYIRFMDDCNDFIDAHRRQLEPGKE